MVLNKWRARARARVAHKQTDRVGAGLDVIDAEMHLADGREVQAAQLRNDIVQATGGKALELMLQGGKLAFEAVLKACASQKSPAMDSLRSTREAPREEGSAIIMPASRPSASAHAPLYTHQSFPELGHARLLLVSSRSAAWPYLHLQNPQVDRLHIRCVDDVSLDFCLENSLRITSNILKGCPLLLRGLSSCSCVAIHVAFPSVGAVQSPVPHFSCRPGGVHDVSAHPPVRLLRAVCISLSTPPSPCSALSKNLNPREAWAIWPGRLGHVLARAWYCVRPVLGSCSAAGRNFMRSLLWPLVASPQTAAGRYSPREPSRTSAPRRRR